jgi:dienelactone hydrolase
VIALHGHGSWGAGAIVKAPDDPLGAALHQQLNYDYAGQLARRGYMVFVPELRGFGNRMEADEYREGEAGWVSSCYAVGVNALLLGKTLLGLRIYDVMRLIDYIWALPDDLADTLGCVGLSGGGMVTLFTTALDTRITCAVVSGYFNIFRNSIMAVRHCLCNFIPGIVRVAEMVDIAGLIVPRPLLIETGTQDPIFPTTATQQAYKELQKIYAVFDATQNLDIDVFQGEHEWSGRKAYDWLAKWL